MRYRTAQGNPTPALIWMSVGVSALLGAGIGGGLVALDEFSLPKTGAGLLVCAMFAAICWMQMRSMVGDARWADRGEPNRNIGDAAIAARTLAVVLTIAGVAVVLVDLTL